MLATIPKPRRSAKARAAAIVGSMLAIVLVSQLAARITPPPTQGPSAIMDPLQPVIGDLDPGTISAGSEAGADDGATVGIVADENIARIRADIEFWGARVDKDPDDFISSNRLGISQIEFARSTGDLSAYLNAEAAFDLTLKRDPKNEAALAYKGSVLVSLHRFVDAAALARDILARRPNDPVALATLGDAQLELGDLATARDAYTLADRIAGSAATEVRLGHLAFITGDTTEAIRAARASVVAADTEGASGNRAAFYHYQLADVLISTGDRAGAESAYRAALMADPNSFSAHSGLAKVAASGGDLDHAIRELTAAIAIVPQPEFLARRGDLYTLRGQSGDGTRAADDYATVEVIAKLAGEAAGVYDRTLALYLANHRLDPARAVALTEAELAFRKDVYGEDAYAWALLQDGRPAEADAAMSKALAFGTKDAKLFYHAGMIDAAMGRTEPARTMLENALALDPGFDPLQAARARSTLAALP